MNAKDWNGHVPDTDSRESRDDVASPSRTARDAELELAELKGFIRAMAIVAEANVKRLEELTRQATEQLGATGGREM